MSNNFCVVPWIHLNTEPTGKVKPCCAFDANDHEWNKLQESSLEEIWNCDAQKKLRKQFLNNERPVGCMTCFNKEDSGSHSMRMAMNERFAHHIEVAKNETSEDGQYENFNLVYWDFRFSNICNFKCRMCGHGLSSSWYEDLHDKHKYVKFLDSNYYKQDLMTYVDQCIDIVEEIYFAGGEPLLMPEHYKILDKLIENQRYDVFLRYNTNLSTLKYKDYDLVDTWKKFNKVDIFASIDGTYENAEYTRSGTDWIKIDENFKYINSVSLEYKNINLIINSTIHLLSVFHFSDVIDKIIECRMNPRRIVVNNVIWPNHLRICLLPDHLKNDLIEKFTDHLEKIPERYKGAVKEHYDSILFFLNKDYTDEDLFIFVRDTLRLDKLRNESVHDACPELSEWITELTNIPSFKSRLLQAGLINE